MVIQILKSLFLVLLTSSGIAFVYTSITNNKSFIEIFAISTILQFIFFYFYNSIFTYITRLKLERENLETIKLINTNNVIINCESCKKVNNVRVDLSQDNSFICEHCKTENILEVTYNTIVKTKI